MRILDHALLSARMFFPRAAHVRQPFTVPSGGAALACFRAAPHPHAPTVLHFHGNAEVVADYVPDFVDLLLALGVNVVLGEYRGYGGSTGRPSLGALLHDAGALLAALDLPPERVIAFGRQVGSIAAIELASRHPLGGLIVESGIADPLERIRLHVTPDELGVTADALEAEVAARLDHERKLAAYHGPLLALHAVHDEIVDAAHAVRILGWAAGEDRELVLLPRGGHNEVLSQNRARYVAALRSFLARATATGGAPRP